MSLGEISRSWIEYREVYRMMKRRPEVLTYQYLTAKAYGNLLMLQAQYRAEVKPL